MTAKRWRGARRSGTVGAVAAAAVQHVVDAWIGRRRRAEQCGGSERRDRVSRRARQPDHFSVAMPSTIAVEQLYTTLVVPKHQLMSLLRAGK